MRDEPAGTGGAVATGRTVPFPDRRGARTGLGGGEPLSTWLRDVPAPAWTRRPRAKDDLRETAVAMRKEGRSYREIAEVVGRRQEHAVPVASRRPADRGAAAGAGARGPASGATRRAQAIRASAAQRRAHDTGRGSRAQITSLSESELFVAGVVAYWAEGSKNKPWRTGARVSFLNSDPAMIVLFLRWLALIGVDADRLQLPTQHPRVRRRGSCRGVLGRRRGSAG